MKQFTTLVSLFWATMEKLDVSLSEFQRLIDTLPDIISGIRQRAKTYLGDLFHITNTYEIDASEEEFDTEKIESFFDPIKKSVEEDGKTFYFYNDLSDILKGVKIQGHAPIQYAIYRFLKKLTCQSIFDEAKLHDIYTTDDIYVACEKTLDIFHQGEVVKKRTGVFVPFMIGHALCKVSVYRYSAGDVRVNLFRVDLDGTWDAGVAVGFSNKRLKT